MSKYIFNLFFGLSLNDSISPLFEQLMYFHDLTIKILVLISILIVGVLYCVWFSSSYSNSFMDKKFIEIFWTLIPACILVFLSLPSLSLLYYSDLPYFQSFNTSSQKGSLIKVIGHQWYWSYEYNVDSEKVLSYDSFITPFSEGDTGQYRLLEVDKPLVIKCLSKNLIQGISDDVMHSWTCPSFGMKFDVVPGRLKSSTLISKKVGVFYGQCSEICGAKHSFMPIEVEVFK